MSLNVPYFEVFLLHIFFQVTLLLTCFSEQENNEATRDIVRNVSLYNRKFSGRPLSVSNICHNVE